MPLLLPLLLVLSLGCTRSPDEDTGADTGDTSEPPPTCWDLAGEGEPAVHVSTEGDDNHGDGSQEHPFATAERALEATRAGGPRTLLLDEGEHTATLELGPADAGLVVAGCGPERVHLSAGDPERDLLRVSQTQGLRIRGLSLRGGTHALVAWQGAEVELEAVLATETTSHTILIDGATTRLQGADLTVQGRAATKEGGGGAGLVIQGSSLVLERSHIVEVAEQGIRVTGNGSEVELADVEIEGCTGDGMLLQDWVQAQVRGGRITRSGGHGLLAVRPQTVVLSGVEITGNGAGSTLGHGVVVSRGETTFEPETMTVSTESCALSGHSGAGILLEGVQVVRLRENTLEDNGLETGGVSVFTQREAAVIDPTPDPFVALEDHEAIPY